MEQKNYKMNTSKNYNESFLKVIDESKELELCINDLHKRNGKGPLLRATQPPIKLKKIGDHFIPTEPILNRV